MYTYVDYSLLGRIINSWGDVAPEIAEVDKQDSALVGDAWGEMIVGKHGEGAHSQNQMMVFSTRMAAYNAGINALGGHIIDRDMPMYLRSLKISLDNFEKYEAKQFRNEPVKTATFYRSS